MKIAIVGPGAIGSTFAWHLSRAGHEVTVVARGARLIWLREERAIVRGDGERAHVVVASALDVVMVWDLVLVTVLSPQVAAVLPTWSSLARKRHSHPMQQASHAAAVIGIEPRRTGTAADLRAH